MNNITDYLDDEEKELIETFNNSNTIKRIPSKEEQEDLKKSAKRFLSKETKMNIRIDPVELNLIKEKAKDEGLKYQTYVKSIIHKYITGQLIESKRIG